MKLLLLVLLLDYEGKYASDPRLAAARKALPAQLAAARRMVGVEEAVRIRLEDLGKGRAGPVARTKRDADGYVIVLYTEPLVLRAHDPARTLAHELVHVRQKKRWGALRAVSMPPWVVEGMAIYLSGQLDTRARVLAAHVGREPVPVDPAVRLVNGLAGRHTLLDYYEDGAAFAAVEERFGRKKADAFIEALLDGRRPKEAAALVLGERWAAFEQRSRTFALRKLRPLIATGRKEILRFRAHVEAAEYSEIDRIPHVPGIYEADDAYLRARALLGLGRPALALDLLDKMLLARPVRETTLLERAIRLELDLLKAKDSNKAYETRRKQAALDLAPYR